MFFLTDYGLFLAETITWVIAILVILIVLFGLIGKNKGATKAKLSIKKINDQYNRTEQQIKHLIQSKAELKQERKAKKQTAKQTKKQKSASKKRLFVLDFHGDIQASAVASLREEITAILLSAQPQDEVLLRLESGGGMVPHYGLAASQLKRLKDANLKLTVAVDKIAASGGYMMACLGNQIIAAPFAIVGSIGVIAQLPNFHRYLEKKSIDFEQITAGEYKRTLTMLGQNTRKARAKFQEDINETHELFKNHIVEHRPQLDLAKVATGEHWFARQALALQLIDTLKTSDDYLLAQREQADIYAVKYQIKRPLTKRLGAGVNALLLRCLHPTQSQSGQDYL